MNHRASRKRARASLKAHLWLTTLLVTLAACSTGGSKLATTAPQAVDGAPNEGALPRFSHIFVIVEENKSFDQVMNPKIAPHLSRLARDYGTASAFYGEVHPSEANYVALLGGDTFGIHDDDAFYCKRRQVDRFCAGSAALGYAEHTVEAKHLGAQLEERGLTWKGYYGDLPEPGSLAVVAGQLRFSGRSVPASLYASKHSGFLNFASVQADPRRAEKIVGLDQLDRDLADDKVPNFALIVPNQCDEMHGLIGPGVPADCNLLSPVGLIRRGDRVLGSLVARLQKSKAWLSAENTAIVITFDEGSGGSREGCCAVRPNAPSNYGGGRIPTVVITNHGPRGVSDPTPYNHYSLLRTIEDAFGIEEHLRHAADERFGVRTMTPLFSVTPVAKP